MFKKLAGFLIFILTLTILVIPHNAIAASSSAVTSTFESKDLSAEDFSGKNLQLAEFTKVKLEGANLSNADLRGSVFNGVMAENINLSGADFTNGLAYVTNFDNADLTDSILREAIMLRSTFNHAKIKGADFTQAVLDNQQIIELCKYADGINSKTGASTRQSLGCP
ncbi:pentapeptide repeat-containing protein [Geminocystis sp. GBBB08]|uniref:pentapeptide repeat-containing protein n=1 Tax=Geminocystis sp. GBBB08 TaxID=2604140 RepID=UPI0027E2E5DD|nr:pentapeptide repeat-containing protein [Geminocystis sp. GBBB08]MBL1210022.1 pentapeptide repeat-containing protein [Geminocystis sp. GBBB08]